MTEIFLQILLFRHLYAEAVSVYYSKDTWIQRRLFDRYKEEPWHFTF